jgi:hypothetical protein
MTIAERFPGPMEIWELGASAGLNLLLDRYGYDLGGRLAGDADSSLFLRPEWKGPPPPDAPATIVRRRGVDLEPLDARRDGERLLAYVWPDQEARLAQLGTALAIAAREPPPIDQADAAAWLNERLGEPQPARTVRVVLHSIAFQYFPGPTKARIAENLEAAGAAAAPDRPLAWLRYEFDDRDEKITLRLKAWPGGEERLLAYCHPHGRSVRWLG